jgi:hypothetical protein
LQGGLGNQLFQVAFGIAQSKETDGVRFLQKNNLATLQRNDSGIPLVLSKFGFELQELKLPNPIIRACNFLMREYANHRESNLKCQVVKGAIQAFLKTSKAHYSLILGEGLGYFDLPKKGISENELAIGYFQTHRWADQVSNEMLRIINSTETDFNVNASVNKRKSVMVHVRRGDYDKDGFGWLGSSYYEQALQKVNRFVAVEQVILFSDNFPLAYEMLEKVTSLPIVSIEVSGESAYATLRKMSGAAAYVIANSSLSWWSAYLSQNTARVVVAPQKWFKGFPDPNELLPEDWMKIESNFL